MLELPQNIDRDAQLLDLDRADCEESLYEFLKAAWRYIDPAPWKDAWHIDAIAEHLQAVVDGHIQKLIINLPPRHCKSLLLSVAFDAWTWAQPTNGPISGPGVAFLHASYADKLSLRDSVKCRRLIESPWYQARWGNRFQLTSDQNTKSRFTNDKGGERLITSIAAGVTGEGGNCFVAGTMVSTPFGQLPIEKLRTGDSVLSFNIQRGKVVKSRVLATARRKSSDLCTLREVSGCRFVCTADHLIYSPGRGFVRAGEVGEGDRLLVAGGDSKWEGKNDSSSNLRQLRGSCRPAPLLGTQSDWHVANIAEVFRDCSQEVCVYDIQVEGESNFFAEGILVHNCIIIDDPNAANDVSSEATTESTIDWWTTAMPTRLNDPDTGAFIIIQQRLAENDLTGHILEKEADGWTHLCLPGRYEPERSFHTSIGWKDPRTEPGQLLWPERFSETSLKRLEVTMGPWVFAGQIQQRPEPKGGGIIKREWWRLWEPDSYPPMEFVLATLDGAFTEDRMNDPSGMIVWGIFSGDVSAPTTRIVGPDGNAFRPDSTYSEFAPRLMCMYAWDTRLELHDLVEKTANTCIKMKVDLLLIENKASGISVAQEIRRLYNRERFGVELFDPKSQDKAARLYSVQHLFAEGIVHAPDRPWMERVIAQVAQFPKAKHDEYVDLTSMGLRKLRDMGLLVRQSEREAELEAQKVYPRHHHEPLYPA